MSQKTPFRTLWAVFILVVLAIPLYIWGSGLEWHLKQVTLYAFFPLLGLLAFSLMWLQIITLTLKPYLAPRGIPAEAFLKRTGIFVLLLIIFHPVLLGVAMYQAGAGYPLQSLYSYEPPMLHIFITYALIAWSIFILSEFAFRLQKATWMKKINPFVEYINYGAFFLIFWHSIHLGTNLQEGWVRDVWWLYGASALLLLIWMTLRTKTNEEAEG